eukprot:SAG31_NODE_2027_length_6639_cov_10.777676_7_plen_45_part_00
MAQAGFVNCEFCGWSEFWTSPTTRGASFKAEVPVQHVMLGGKGV